MGQSSLLPPLLLVQSCQKGTHWGGGGARGLEEKGESSFLSINFSPHYGSSWSCTSSLAEVVQGEKEMGPLLEQIASGRHHHCLTFSSSLPTHPFSPLLHPHSVHPSHWLSCFSTWPACGKGSGFRFSEFIGSRMTSIVPNPCMPGLMATYFSQDTTS